MFVVIFQNMLQSKRALEDLQSLEDLLYEDMQESFGLKRQRRFVCQGALGCSRTPIYGVKSREPTHCTDHKDDETMVNVVHRLCRHSSLCFTQASFGYEPRKPLYCRTHKLPDMQNVVSRRCEQDYCLMVPSFGFERGNALRCGTHRLPGMWNVSASTCKYLNCRTFATYGYLDKKAVRCATHRLPDMIPTKQQKRGAASMADPSMILKDEVSPGMCRVCGIRAYYGNCETKRAFCKSHMDPSVHWRVVFCDRGKCTQVATHVATPEAKHLFVCDSHVGGFSQRFAPPHLVRQQEVQVFKEGVHLDDNPLEVAVAQALQ